MHGECHLDTAPTADAAITIDGCNHALHYSQRDMRRRTTAIVMRRMVSILFLSSPFEFNHKRLENDKIHLGSRCRLEVWQRKKEKEPITSMKNKFYSWFFNTVSAYKKMERKYNFKWLFQWLTPEWLSPTSASPVCEVDSTLFVTTGISNVLANLSR